MLESRESRTFTRAVAVDVLWSFSIEDPFKKTLEHKLGPQQLNTLFLCILSSLQYSKKISSYCKFVYFQLSFRLDSIS